VGRRRLAFLLTIGVLGVAAAPVFPVVAATPASAATLPSGFTDTTVTAGLAGAMDVAALPDGRFLVARRAGAVTLMNHDGSGKVDVLNLTVCNDGEQGLLGITVDPQFAANGYFYVYYSRDAGGGCGGDGLPATTGSKNRVSRFTLSGTAAGSEAVLLDNMPEWPGNNHDGGTVHIAQDGKLYVSVGDGGTGRPPTNPTDLGVPNGKILRVNLDGTPAAGNPFGTTPCKDTWAVGGGPCGEIYARGLRNPFRLGFKADGASVKFRINDVGESTWEEVDDGIAGADYGWPTREGPCPTGQTLPCAPAPAGLTDPVAFYGRANNCGTITGGAFVPDGLWGGYDGSYVFADWKCGELYVQRPGQTGQTFDKLSADSGAITSIKFLPEGSSYAMYYTVGDQLHRVIGPTGTVAPPITDLKFSALQPTRLLDTRAGTGVAAGKLAAGAAISLTVTGGTVPADAKAVVLNLTATLADAAGFVTAWPTGQPQPPTSSLNLSTAGETAANAVVVPVGQGGQVNLFTFAGTHLVADVTGYFTEAGSSTNGRFHATTGPTRLLDSRTGLGGKTGAFTAGQSFDLQVGGKGGVPDDASAVALTVTYTGPTAPGYLAVWPTGQAQPLASTTNPNGVGDIRSNLAMIPLGTNGKVSIFSFAPTDVVVDVVGYFSTGSGGTGLFTVVAPSRVADSRLPSAPFGRIGAGAEATMDFHHLVPPNAGAALYNLTATNTVAGGYLTAHPSGTVVPEASSVNWSAGGQSRAALTISSLAAAQKVGLFAFTATDAIIDLSGWFTS
jgi:glucose/arabinose dehydrogenase